MASRDLLDVPQPLDVLLQRVASGARARAGHRVGSLDDDRLDRSRLDLVVMGLHRVRDRLGLAVAAGDVGADQRVRALDLVAHRLADVVQERGPAGRLDRRAELGGDQSPRGASTRPGGRARSGRSWCGTEAGRAASTSSGSRPCTRASSAARSPSSTISPARSPPWRARRSPRSAPG